MKRLKELDFLRGVAILGVFFAHHYLFYYTSRSGWIFVDLFFVLSGFLVSGLLFGEYQNKGEVSIKTFLIRRGLKIYPLFYISVFTTAFLILFFPDFPSSSDTRFMLNYKGVFIGLGIEILFLQSYLLGLWPHHWSLAVEEHFYILLSILIAYLTATRKLVTSTMIKISIFVFGFCLLARFTENLFFPEHPTFSASHLRVDSLFWGVLISYFYHFEPDALQSFYLKYRRLLIPFPLVLLFVPFAGPDAYFTRTLGFSLIAMAFSSVLLIFLYEQRVKTFVINNRISTFVAWVGLYSYSIYLFHYPILRYTFGEGHERKMYLSGEWDFWQLALSFLIYVTVAITIGVTISKLVEIPVLRVRDRWFPRPSTALERENHPSLSPPDSKVIEGG